MSPVESDERVLKRFEQLWRWRRAAAWAPIVWFPLALARLLMDAPIQAVVLGVAGLVFAALARIVVWSARCPACETPLRASPAGGRHFWDDARCGTCDRSLFDLRRARARGQRR